MCLIQPTMNDLQNGQPHGLQDVWAKDDPPEVKLREVAENGVDADPKPATTFRNLNCQWKIHNLKAYARQPAQLGPWILTWPALFCGPFLRSKFALCKRQRAWQGLELGHFGAPCLSIEAHFVHTKGWYHLFKALCIQSWLATKFFNRWWDETSMPYNQIAM